MERLNQPRKKGISKQQVFLLGMLFLLAGVISRSVLQNGILHMGSMTGQQLLEAMSASDTAIVAATIALVLQALETCAIPIFAFLLVSDYETNKKKLLLYLLLAAVVSELPYNYAMYGNLLHTASRNPVFAMVIALAVLYFFSRYSENSFAHVLIKIFVALASLLWAVMLNVEHGVPLLIVTITIWLLRKKKHFLTLFGGMASSACMLVSPFYIVSAMGILPVYLCREETSEDMKIFSYLSYPVLLLAVGLLSNFI